MDNPRDEDLQHKIATVIQRGRLENETAFENAAKVMAEIAQHAEEKELSDRLMAAVGATP